MIYLHESTSSTNDLALEAAREDAPHGACWVADRQTQGRGRREVGGNRRAWFSPASSNIYMSVLLRPDMEPAEATSMTLAAALGVVDALVERTGADIWLKWPNDLYVGDLKLGGLLTEASTEHGRLDGVIAGLGINVNLTGNEVPDELSDIMTSLRIETGERWDRMSLIFAIRDQLVERCETFAGGGLEAVLDDLRAYDRSPGRTVEIQRGDKWVAGTAEGIGDEGQLVVSVDGEDIDVQAGEVRFI